MKSFSLFAIALLTFSVLSCNKVEEPLFATNDEVTVEYNVEFDTETKAIAGEENGYYVWCAAYKKVNKDYVLSSEPTLWEITSSGEANCKVNMVRNQSYKVVFIAQYYSDNGQQPSYHVNEDDAVVTMPDNPSANSANYDLFTYVDEVDDFDGYASGSVELSRRVSQINFVVSADHKAAAVSEGKAPTHSEVTLTGVPKSISLLSGKLSSDTKTVNYKKSETSGWTNDNHLATVYCFSGNTESYVTASLYVYKDTEILKQYTSIPSIPYKVNYRTNVMVSYIF